MVNNGSGESMDLGIFKARLPRENPSLAKVFENVLFGKRSELISFFDFFLNLFIDTPNLDIADRIGTGKNPTA